MKVLSVVGARPQFVKLAPIDYALKASGVDHVIVHTGQHYDSEMSESFFQELGISRPKHNLGVGSGSHGAQTASMIAGLEEIFLQETPDWVLIYGDTNSTLAAAIAAVKIHIKVAHLEAGLRSFNRLMPEEHNRILSDHAADLLLAPTAVAIEHLSKENLESKAIMVGDVMTDVCLQTLARVQKNKLPTLPSLVSIQSELESGNYLVATIHRAENTDSKSRLSEIIEGLQSLPFRVILMTHPRLAAKAEAYGLELNRATVTSIKSVSYPYMVQLVSNSRGVVTDSGGLQKEAYLLGTICTTVRTETEWPETLIDNWNVLSPDISHLKENVLRSKPSSKRGDFYGDGHAAEKVAAALIEFLKK